MGAVYKVKTVGPETRRRMAEDDGKEPPMTNEATQDDRTDRRKRRKARLLYREGS